MSTSKGLRVVDIVEGTSVDGPGLRTAIYFAGCAHGCPGCHNPTTHPFEAGEERTIDELFEIVERNGFNVTLTGGDPLYQSLNLIPFVSLLKKKGFNVWCYTGFTLEEILSAGAPKGAKELLSLLDVLVDGPFVQALRDTRLAFRGSSNQRILLLRELGF